MKYICTACQEPMDWEEFNSHSCPRLTKPQEEKMSVTPEVPAPTPLIRKFETGATRDTDQNKLDYEGFLSPIVLERFGQYMHKHRFQADGHVRASDNWQHHFGADHFSVCMKSLWRHFMDLWMEHRGFKSREGIEDALMGIIFNTMAYADKYLKDKKRKETK